MKRGQSAMEFLMSYGWAILVALAAIAALAYFGVFSPEKNIPESCIFFPGISCTDFKVDSSGIVIVATNGMGKNLESFEITVLGDKICGGDSSIPTILYNADQTTIKLNCTGESPEPGTKFIRDLEITYREFGGLNHTRMGTISSFVEN